MTFWFATADDCPLLAELNHQLIQDEGHRNRMRVAELERRMRDWLAGDYRAVLFEERSEVVAYALFRELPDEIYLRQSAGAPSTRCAPRSGRRTSGSPWRCWSPTSAASRSGGRWASRTTR